MIAKKQNRTTHEVDEKPTLPFVMIPLYLPRLQKKTRRKKTIHTEHNRTAVPGKKKRLQHSL